MCGALGRKLKTQPRKLIQRFTLYFLPCSAAVLLQTTGNSYCSCFWRGIW